MSRNSEYNANLSLNETAKENKRWAHTHVPKPQPITRKRKLANLVTSWPVLIALYALAVGGMFLYNLWFWG